ncbi:MAG: hypothetical protein LDL41_07540 [Coleofasciculus sp. S288]|nr:hypothetical protein [Coleofasciculus sp. S288]
MLIREEKRSPQRYRRPRSRRRERIKRQPGNSALRKRLSILLNGDTRTAQRLVNQACANNPGRSVDWCVEKVIWDLERDRL